MIGLVKTDIPELNGLVRPLGHVCNVPVFKQMNVGGFWPMTALELEADGFAHRQERKVVLPYSRAREVDCLTIFRLDEAGAAGGAQVLDSSNHSDIAPDLTRVKGGLWVS